MSIAQVGSWPSDVLQRPYAYSNEKTTYGQKMDEVKMKLKKAFLSEDTQDRKKF